MNVLCFTAWFGHEPWPVTLSAPHRHGIRGGLHINIGTYHCGFINCYLLPTGWRIAPARACKLTQMDWDVLMDIFMGHLQAVKYAMLVAGYLGDTKSVEWYKIYFGMVSYLGFYPK